MARQIAQQEVDRREGEMRERLTREILTATPAPDAPRPRPPRPSPRPTARRRSRPRPPRCGGARRGAGTAAGRAATRGAGRQRSSPPTPAPTTPPPTAGDPRARRRRRRPTVREGDLVDIRGHPTSRRSSRPRPSIRRSRARQRVGGIVILERSSTRTAPSGGAGAPRCEARPRSRRGSGQCGQAMAIQAGNQGWCPRQVLEDDDDPVQTLNEEDPWQF